MDKIGKYKILGTLGKGGMGIVYKGLDPDIEREVAIKSIRFDKYSEGTLKDDLMGRFIREARAAGKLAHPNIVMVYDVCREEDLTYIVMQYIEGQSLQTIMDSGRKFTTLECQSLLRPICDALDYAHKAGIVHRDIKPANILIDKSGKPHLADFGVARIEESTMTQSGMTVGTLSYMSPEQIKGLPIDGRSDIFALGIILYELLAGKMPFFGDNISTIVYKIVNEQPPRVTEVNKELPPGYDFVVMKALAKNPENRYETCRALSAGLESAEQVLEQTRALEVERSGRTAVFKRKKWLIPAVAAASLAVVAMVVLLGSSGPKKTSGRDAKSAGQVQQSGPAPVSPPSGNAAPKSESAVPAAEELAALKASFEGKRYDETAKLAKDLLDKYPSNPAVLDFQKRARNEIVAGQVAPVLQSGIASFKRGDYSACVRDMEKVLSVDRNNAEAARYLSQADQEISKKDIIAMIERHRVAEESKDLVAVLDHVGSPALLRQWESDYRLIFNGHDGIRSSITVNSIAFTSRTEATAGVSRLLSAVYKKTGIRRPVIEGNRTWRLRKIDAVWKITAES